MQKSRNLLATYLHGVNNKGHQIFRPAFQNHQIRFKSTSTQSVNNSSDQQAVDQKEQIKKIFEKDSTFGLVKKLFIYKMMSSNLFINYSLGVMNMMYKIWGVRLTNFLINKTAGEVFTSGETIQSLIVDIEELSKRKIKGVANYVAEGLHSMDERQIQITLKDLTDSIMSITEGKDDGHLAIKLTALISIDIMTRLSKAQQVLLEDVMQLWTKEDPISIQEIKANLDKIGFKYSDDDVQWLFNKVKLADNSSQSLSQVERWANTHVLPLNPQDRHPVLLSFCKHLGVTDQDINHFDLFAKRVIEMTELSHKRNCKLYVDAEQTYMQKQIDSIATQLTQKFNRGDRTIIMNGFQQYLKITEKKIPLEIQSAKKLGYNLGIKLIRGAYMNEERRLAKQHDYESPIWDTIDDTHNNYNRNLKLVIENLNEQDRMLIGSHNVESVNIAKQLLRDLQKNDGRAYFGQLKAFSDQITGQLANEGFTVYKYLPYGPTEKVMPYLVRRGQESRQVLREQKYQNEFLKGEIKRRMSLSK
ncbi:proline oxidase [Stylonychia lemnae]|uniref:Proline dehydrogenase n=1 Tax=Stylonychia lemnae TaxID=5949 RepID=A0A078B6F9_STYLE|nr:proline oxidase [Stylonychia lemnae]|eukprot:CDW89143.1 proline oxidase [Stylonychia lemnae]